MQQLEIEFFWPLTEQIPLDLDYTECDKPKLYYTIPNGGTLGQVLMSGGTGLTWATPPQTIAFMPTNDSVGYWKVGEGLQMHNKKRPNWLNQIMTKIFFGWEWKDK
jgi:hypothetical protein